MAKKETIKVPLLKFGSETCDLEINKGATYKDLYEEVPNKDSLDISVSGTPIEEKFDEIVTEEPIFAAPKKISQGS